MQIPETCKTATDIESIYLIYIYIYYNSLWYVQSQKLTSCRRSVICAGFSLWTRIMSILVLLPVKITAQSAPTGTVMAHENVHRVPA